PAPVRSPSAFSTGCGPPRSRASQQVRPSLMWSDRPSKIRRRRLADRLRAILPAPRPGSRGSKTPLRVAGAKAPPDPEQVAAELLGQPGFAWLGGGGDAGRPPPRPPPAGA